VSLYQVQKFLFELNRTPVLQSAYTADRHLVLAPYALTDEEVRALTEPDIGLLYHLGVNGQILMHFAAFHQVEWSDYLDRMRAGLVKYGPVREGVYAMTGYEGVESHAAALRQQAASSGNRA
jgi:Aromatic-ring-opening dioxygenase LigAB, LigA subunit